MVSDLSNRDRDRDRDCDRDRGQLILIAGITLAFVILGIVVVFNGVLFTQTMASSSTTETTDVEVAEYEIRQSVQGTVQRTNLDHGDGIDDAEEWLKSPYRNASVGDRPSTVDVTDIDDSEDASWHREGLDSETDQEIFNATDDHAARTEQHVGHFAVLIDTDDETEDAEITVEIDDETVEINDNGALDVGGECTLGYDDEQEFVTVDFVTGTTNASEFDDDCDYLDQINPDEKLDEIEITVNDYEGPGENLPDAGRYEIVAKGSGDLSPDEDVDGDDAVWQAEVTYQYDSSNIHVERTITVDIYGDQA